MQSPASSELLTPDKTTARIGDAPLCTDSLRLAALERQISLLLAAKPDTPGSRLKLVDIVAVCKLLVLKKSAVHAMVARGDLPAPIKFGTSRRATARWNENELIDFLLAKAAERPTPNASVKARQSVTDIPSDAKKSHRKPVDPRVSPLLKTKSVVAETQ